jgi:hypothetical protein
VVFRINFYSPRKDCRKVCVTEGSNGAARLQNTDPLKHRSICRHRRVAISFPAQSAQKCMLDSAELMASTVHSISVQLSGSRAATTSHPVKGSYELKCSENSMMRFAIAIPFPENAILQLACPLLKINAVSQSIIPSMSDRNVEFLSLQIQFSHSDSPSRLTRE